MSPLTGVDSVPQYELNKTETEFTDLSHITFKHLCEGRTNSDGTFVLFSKSDNLHEDDHPEESSHSTEDQTRQLHKVLKLVCNKDFTSSPAHYSWLTFKLTDT